MASLPACWAFFVLDALARGTLHFLARDLPTDQVARRVYHGCPHLVEYVKRSLVATNAKLLLELQGNHRHRSVGHEKGGPEPSADGQRRPVHDRVGPRD
jgi:hypothetical protein